MVTRCNGRPPEKYCLPAPLSDLALPLPSCLNGAFKCLEREGREEESGEIFRTRLIRTTTTDIGQQHPALPPSRTKNHSNKCCVAEREGGWQFIRCPPAQVADNLSLPPPPPKEAEE